MKYRCPKCGSPVWRVGFQMVNRNGDKRQQYRCKRCRFTTIHPVEIRSR